MKMGNRSSKAMQIFCAVWARHSATNCLTTNPILSGAHYAMDDVFAEGATVTPQAAIAYEAAASAFAARMNGMRHYVDAALTQTGLEIGTAYVDIGGVALPSVGMADASYDLYTGKISVAEFALSAIPGARLGRTGSAVVRGEGGRFGHLHARRTIGDDLTPHHIPQAGRSFTSYADGGAVVMTTGEHALTRTYKARGARTLKDEEDLPFRQTLERDIRDVRKIGGSDYNTGLRDVLNYYRKTHPELMKKGR